MAEKTVTVEMLAAKFGSFLPHLAERQRRLVLGAEARALGHGGIRMVARAAGVRAATVSLGAAELEAGAEPPGRVRRPGGGRKRDSGLVPALLALPALQGKARPCLRAGVTGQETACPALVGVIADARAASQAR